MSRIRDAFFLVIGVFLFCSPIIAADDNDKSVENDPEAAKQKVLAWIDDYREDQVLFHDEDIAKLRKELASESPEEAIRWWQKTARARAALESPQWQETSKWLREFLKVQAIFSDEQIAELRSEAGEAAKKGSSREFKDILADIERFRVNLVRGASDDNALRLHKLQVFEAYKKESAAQRAGAAKAAAFETNKPSQPVAVRDRRVPTAPLINSLDVARWSVMRNFWRW